MNEKDTKNTYVNTLLTLSRLYERIDRFTTEENLEKSIECLNLATKIDPKNEKKFLFLKGQVFHGAEKHEKAVEIYTECLESNPNDINILFNRAYAHGYDIESRLKDLSTIIDLNPGPDALFAALEDRKNRYLVSDRKLALNDLRRMLEIIPQTNMSDYLKWEKTFDCNHWIEFCEKEIKKEKAKTNLTFNFNNKEFSQEENNQDTKGCCSIM